MRAGGWTSAFLCWAVYGLLVKADGWDVGVPVLAVCRNVSEGWWVELGVPGGGNMATE